MHDDDLSLHQTLRVLLIEDDPAEAKILEEMLYEAGGFEIARHARTLDDGLATKVAVDVVLLDLTLPDAEGLETFTRTRRTFGHLPIVVVSGHADELISVRAVVEGAQDYLVKGNFEPWSLARSLRHAFERHRLEKRRREAEEALRLSEERYRRLFEDDLTGNVVAAPDGSILACNPAFVRLFGFQSADIACDFSLCDIFPTSVIEELVERLRLEHHLERCELSGRCFDGTPVVAVGNAVATVEDGKLVDWRAYLIDDTERRKTEEQLLQAQKMEAVGRVAGGVAHDFSNIVTAISFHADSLLAHLPGESPLADRAQSIRDASQRAASLTSQLLAFSRRQVMRPQILDINNVVQEMRGLFSHFIGEDIQVEVELAERLCPVMADPSQIEQVLLNLVVNARDAMPAGGTLKLATREVELTAEGMKQGEVMRRGRYVRLTVADDGIGMDEYTRRRIFEPFFTTKERERGSGLGLSTVYGIVQQSKGYVEVESVEGEGSCFQIHLPCTEIAAAPAERAPSAEAPPESGDETVLVVEDDHALRSLMLEALAGQGYRSLEASTCGEALEMAADDSLEIDLLVVDIVMPDMRGTELARQLQAQYPAMKILLISGYGDSVPGGSESARHPFLEKPFNSLILSRKVREVLDES